MEIESVIFLILLFLIAMLYSGIGHGGASGYLALMSLFHFAPEVMRPSALVLNLIVSLVAAWKFSEVESLNRKLFFLLIAGSIPAAYFGATINVNASLYKIILGVIILFQAIRLIFIRETITAKSNLQPGFPVVVSGGIIGFISGLIGIGGGILLSPLLLFMGWATMKQTAYISALFIFMNSLSGLLGLLPKWTSFDPVLYLWIGIALAGGFAGASMGSKTRSVTTLTTVLGIVLLIAGLKLIIL